MGSRRSVLMIPLGFRPMALRGAEEPVITTFVMELGAPLVAVGLRALPVCEGFGQRQPG